MDTFVNNKNGSKILTIKVKNKVILLSTGASVTIYYSRQITIEMQQRTVEIIQRAVNYLPINVIRPLQINQLINLN